MRRSMAEYTLLELVLLFLCKGSLSSFFTLTVDSFVCFGLGPSPESSESLKLPLDHFESLFFMISSALMLSFLESSSFSSLIFVNPLIFATFTGLYPGILYFLSLK